MAMNNLQLHLEVRGLSKVFQVNNNNVCLFENLDLSVRPGESVAIVGASGVGKTTLLSLLAGIDVPTAGQIWVEGHELSSLSDEQRAKLRLKHTGFIFQDFHLIPNMTVLDNVILAVELAKIPQSKLIAQHWLDRVGLQDRYYYYPRFLSGGEQQRVAIARSFAMAPDILFADELTGNLDPSTSKLIINLIFDLNRISQTTLIIVTHNEDLASRCDRSLHLCDGALR